MKRMIFLLTSLLLVSSLASAAIKTETVTYRDNGTEMKGYMAYDDSIEGERPGVLVVHEWWGHNEYPRERARMLAEEGYIAFALDMYGDGKTASHPDDAGKFAGAVRENMEVAESRFHAALRELRDHPLSEDDNIAAIGYCFGGGIVLEMARRGMDIDGVASFHGTLGTQSPAGEGDIKTRIRVYHGADDPFVKPEAVEAFKQEMNKAGVDYEFTAYPGAKHAFTNPGATELGEKFELPLAYDEQADKKSWQSMLEFFEEIFD
ncbi:dienelactone hydrolase family protein [Thiohalophilus thiocyanatoxydans]|uniref:Dienelactone hydrolase n=1 Tax=Thiohalophilus thiocyanatoxydans TaxID=381308 RepID=A0A4R8III3_9GAMM|nr:dienelactone hydrolase family protein [Thiohalophilus thiocyanatoxydans]TDY00496.1 dienelactone hydrolase [Thiohalophilus thiocyanatoxydans]